MSDDFDDLFISPKRHTPAEFGGYPDDDDEFGATANPFADLQSSSILAGSTYDNVAQLQSNLNNPGSSLVRTRSVSSSNASTSRTPSTPSTPLSPRQTVSGYLDDELDRDNEVGRNRVSVSPFEYRLPDRDDMVSTVSALGRASNGSELEQTGSPFTETRGNSTPSTGPPTPSLTINDFGDDDGGFKEREEESHRHSNHDTDRADAASMRTVGLGSDAASMRSTNTLIHAEPVPISTPLDDDASGRPTFILTVGDPTKVGSAIDPLNQHTVYTIRTRTSSTSFRKQDFSVLRRYRDFLWLSERLNENNPGVIVPPTPGKAAIGRFSENFVETRRLALQQCLQAILRHPMLYTDPDLRIFLESDSFHIDIKSRATVSSSAITMETKPSFFSSLTSPRFVEFDEFFESRRSSLDALEASLKSLTTALSTCSRTRLTICTASAELYTSLMALAACELSENVKLAVAQLADRELSKREILEAQAKDEEHLLLSTAENWGRLIASVRIALTSRIKAYQTHQRAESNVKTAVAQHEKAKKAARTHPDLVTHALIEITEAERRVIATKRDFEDVSKLIKSEMIRFDKEKVEDFKSALERYAAGLVKRQTDTVMGWKEYLAILEKSVGNGQPKKEENGQRAEIGD